MYSIGGRIAELRKNKKMTQEELANIVGVSAQSVSKWETSQSMPDIMLLPTLASAFDVTVNDLFSIVSLADHYESINPDITPEKAYQGLFATLMRGLSDTEIVSKEDVNKTMDRLRASSGQSGLVSYENLEMNGATYVNRSIGLSFVKTKGEALSLLDSDKVSEVLIVLAAKNVRRVLQYMLTNGNATVTAAVVATKCVIPLNDAETALNKLCNFGLIQIQSVETEEDLPLKVYHLYGEYKVFMTIFPMFELAKCIAEWRESWIGFRC